MKRIFVCALLVSTVLLALTPIPAQSNTTDATATLKKFYDWYLRQPNHVWEPRFRQVTALFDPGLHKMLQTVLDREASTHDEIMDFDPFVNAQWDAVAYAFGTPTAKLNNVNVPVMLTLSGRPTNFRSKLAAVLRTNGAGKYVIYDIVYKDTKSTLRGLLRIWLKE